MSFTWKWRPLPQRPDHPGLYLTVAPSGDPARPHVSLAWYEPPESEGVRLRGNRSGWQLFDLWVAGNGGADCLSHWADFRDGLPGHKAMARAIARRKRAR